MTPKLSKNHILASFVDIFTWIILQLILEIKCQLNAIHLEFKLARNMKTETVKKKKCNFTFFCYLIWNEFHSVGFQMSSNNTLVKCYPLWIQSGWPSNEQKLQQFQINFSKCVSYYHDYCNQIDLIYFSKFLHEI